MSTQDVSDGWITPEGQPGLVSVIIPTYNRSKLIVDALDSVIAQTYRPIEAIVVDDGSEDDTAEVIQQWIHEHATDDNFTVRYRYQHNAGAPAARNRGLRETSGAYIQYLDSDDLLLSHKITNGIQALERQNVDITYCKTRITDLEGQTLGHCGVKVKKSGWDLPTYTWHISGPLYRRSTVAALGPWLEHLTGSQDWEYCVRAKLGSFRMHFDSTVGSVYRRHNAKRISKPSFDYAYTQSTERAYDRIVALAQVRQIATPAFEAKMGRLYFYRALEYQKYGHSEEAIQCLDKASRMVAESSVIGQLIMLCQRATHPQFARLLLRLINLRNLLMDRLSWHR